MRATFASLALVALAAANPVPSASFAIKTPAASAPAGCATSVSGTFEIEIVNVTSSKVKRDGTPLEITLEGGIMTDAKGRIGSIVANGQFQFDGPPPQDNALYTAGWSVCGNGSLALGGSTIFYECLSGMFYNLYDASEGAQCSPIFIHTIMGASSAAAAQSSDGQITASPVTQISDGQPQATTAVVTQISDGQIQATTAVVTQISDGQIQATTGSPVTQISDGQIQATTGSPVTQISDGQIQATTGSPVTQISDGQIQGPTTTPTKPTVSPVTQISDGQIQGPTGTIPKPKNGTVSATATGSVKSTASPTVAAFTGAAVANTVGFFGFAAGAVALAML